LEEFSLPCNSRTERHTPAPASWSRFFIGVFGLVAVVFFFTRGATPPGVFGEVIRHNRAAAIDATPLFYSEVENIVEIQAGLAEWWGRAGTVHIDSSHAVGALAAPRCPE
jgi:hypothetical protein